MRVVYHTNPKICHAKPGEVVKIDDVLYMVCVVNAAGKKAARELASHGLYDDERPLFLVNVESGEARQMPHLSSRVEIMREVQLVVDQT